MRALLITATVLALLRQASGWADFSYGVDVIPSITEWRFRFWMQKYDKSYSSKEEYKFRYTQFQKTVKWVDYNNFRRKSTHKMALNRFADISDEEWEKMLPNLPDRVEPTEPYKTFNCSSDSVCDLPPSINWVNHNGKQYITDAKETPQHCLGASYAYAAADTIEATYMNDTGNLMTFSPKQIMDCGKAYDMSQCDFGATDDAFRYVKADNKLMALSDYPVDMSNPDCKFNPQLAKAGLNNIYTIPVQVQDIKQALQYGPVTTVVNSKAEVFKSYKTGILSSGPDDCDPKSASLYVVIVGYGNDNGSGYFLIKNNWGKSWGMNGFIKISDSTAGSVRGVCGILTPNYQFQISE